MKHCKETPELCFKRGDDLKLDFTVQDTNSGTAKELKALVEEAEETLKTLQEADPVDTAAVTAAQTALTTAQTNYSNALIVDITGWTITSQVRRAGKMVDTLDVTILDASLGIFALSKDHTSTSQWPIHTLDCDIEFMKPTGKVSSETFHIKVMRDVTA